VAWSLAGCGLSDRRGATVIVRPLETSAPVVRRCVSRGITALPCSPPSSVFVTAVRRFSHPVAPSDHASAIIRAAIADPGEHFEPYRQSFT
jgi:hypothetical protein